MREDRVRTIVIGVLDEALRRTGVNGVVLGGRGPEGTLLGRWISDAEIPLALPSPVALEAARQLSRAVRANDPQAFRIDSWRLAAQALAATGRFLLVGTTTKTTLLLSPERPLEPVLPLADLYASEILALQGECSVPECLEGADEALLHAVDLALQGYLEGRLTLTEAVSGIDESSRARVLDAIQIVKKGWMPEPLVPKFRPFTLGIDLDL